jgi:hypothetical protein
VEHIVTLRDPADPYAARPELRAKLEVAPAAAQRGR